MSSEIVPVKEEYQSDDSENCQVKMETQHSPSERQDISSDVEFSSHMCIKEEAKSLVIEIQEEVGCPAEVKAEPDEWDIDIEEKEISKDPESSSETVQLSSVGLSDHGLILKKEEAGCSGAVCQKMEDDMDPQNRFDRKALNTAGDLLVPQKMLIQGYGNSKIRKKTREDILEAKRRANRIHYEKIKKDSNLRALRKEQQTENYAKRKREKRVVSIKYKSTDEQQIQRQKWRENSRAYYCKNKETKKILQVKKTEDQLMNTENRRVLDRSCSIKLERLDANSQVNLQPNDTTLFGCDICSCKYDQKSDLQDHMKAHTGGKPFKCNHCDFATHSKRNLKEHELRRHTTGELFGCDICSRKYKWKLNLRKHIQLHSGERLMKCSHCDYASSIKKNLRRHELRHTTGKTNDENTNLFGCDICSRKFLWKSDLRDHMTTHSKEKLFKCHYCDYSGKKEKYLIVHLLKHTGDDHYKCRYCDYTSPRKGNLKRHELRHTTGKTNNENTRFFECDICSCKYRRKTNLRSHMRIHTSEKPFKCSHCDYESPIKRNIKRHELRHTTGETNDENTNLFGCDICSCKYRWKSDLRNHIMIHTGEKPFKCGHCDYATHIKKNLKRHEIQHNTGELLQLLGCDICSRQYKRKSNLREHMKKHSDEKSLKCSHCNYTTHTNKNLNRHTLRHVTEKK